MSRISILIPMFNREKYIVECLDSCFIQTFQDFQVIVYDDRSTDNSIKVVEKYKENLDINLKNKIVLIEGKKNKGVGFARNKLLENINTPFATWLDSDDVMHPQRLEKQYNKIQEGYDVVYCYLNTFQGDIENKSSVYKLDTSKYTNNFKSVLKNTLCATGFFSSKLKSVKFNPKVTLGGEDVLWVYSLILKGFKIGQVNESLYYVRFHSDRLGNQKKESKNKNKRIQSNKHLSRELRVLQNQNGIKSNNKKEIKQELEKN